MHLKHTNLYIFQRKYVKLESEKVSLVLLQIVHSQSKTTTANFSNNRRASCIAALLHRDEIIKLYALFRIIKKKLNKGRNTTRQPRISGM